MCRTLEISLRNLFLSIFAISSLSLVSQADEMTKQKFLKEYPVASKDLWDRFENVDCTFVEIHESPEIRIESRFRKTGESEIVHSHFFYEKDGKQSKFENVVGFRRGPRFSLASNPDRPGFYVADSPESPLKTFIRIMNDSNSFGSGLRRFLGSIKDYSWTDRVARKYENECAIHVYAPWGFNRMAIADYMREPGFELIDAKPVDDDSALVEVRFIRHADPKSVFEFVVRFDTDNHWAVTSMDMISVSTKKPLAQFEVRYGPKVDGVAWPESIISSLRPPIRFTRWAFEPSPDNIFRLSHYGIKEPLIDWSSPIPWAVGTITTMIAVMMAFRLIRNHRKRRRALPLSMIGSTSNDLKCDLERSV